MMPASLGKRSLSNIDELLAKNVRASAAPVSDRHVGIKGRAHQTCFDNQRGCFGGDEHKLVSYTKDEHIARYDIGRLHRFGFLAVLRGTLLDSPFLWIQLITMVASSYLFAGYLLWKHGDVSEHQAETIGSVLVAMQGLAAFFLGLFVSLVLSRWSTLRHDVVGALYGATANICTMAGHIWAGEYFCCLCTDSYSRAMRKRTLRYCLVAFSLTFAEARREDSVQLLLESNMITREEKFVLDALPRKAQAVAGWLLHHFHVGAGKRAHRAFERKLLLEQIFRMRGMIGDCHMYVGVQIPLPYTAFITLIVKATMFVSVIDAALSFVIAYNDDDWLTIISQTVMVCLSAAFYQGCLDLHTVLSNPFGYDASDFPQADYFYAMAGACYAQLESESLIMDHINAMSGKGATSAVAVQNELQMMTAEEDDGVSDDGSVDLQAISKLHNSGALDAVALHRVQAALRKQKEEALNARRIRPPWEWGGSSSAPAMN